MNASGFCIRTSPTASRNIPPCPTDLTTGWQEHAACRDDTDPNRWVDLPPVRIRGKNNHAYDARLNELAATCQACPVRAQCLWTALGMNVRGVFAGTDEYDRADLREELDLPTPPRIPAPENAEDARLIDQQFAALRLARRGYTNTEIAETLDVSPMSVSRLTASEDRPSRRRTKDTSKIPCHGTDLNADLTATNVPFADLPLTDYDPAFADYEHATG